MSIDYHLDYGVKLSTDIEYENLYQWVSVRRWFSSLPDYILSTPKLPNLGYRASVKPVLLPQYPPYDWRRNDGYMENVGSVKRA